MMVTSSDTTVAPLDRQRGKHRKFRGTTTVLTSILKIGSSRGRCEKVTLNAASSAITQSGVGGRRPNVGSRRNSKGGNQLSRYPSSSSLSALNVFHPRIPPFPGTYLTSMTTPLSPAPMHSTPSSLTTHITLGPRASPTALHMTSMLVPPAEQTYYMPSHGYLPSVPPPSQLSLSYNMGPPPPPPPVPPSLELYMYMKAYLRDPWSNDGFRLMILLPVGPRDDGTYGILNAGVKPEQVYSLCFYYADSILYYSFPDDDSLYFIPA
ncbi:amyloid beta A4 precursor protein-binding family B member 1-interacting protein-like [Ischnura elegans]|uniref:amyloid beta A4 precursor protein-binding family B member 1-interacting protein-like n=1 Tax=Ischnura elegans TaxID=197161 RepID=UPI001ED8937F|nr:amyloid beta A4 precursor protein-binding family B member 1-interacting protein-like [Ischnura elegans]